MEENIQTIFTVPMQIKKDISLGNLYDFLIADFYGKGKKIQGNEIYNPLILNINGNKTQKLLELNGLSLCDHDKVEDFIQTCKDTIIASLKDYGIIFSSVIRDDKISKDLHRILSQRESEEGIIDHIYVNTCSSCLATFGTDFAIHSCKYCGGTTSKEFSQELFQEINYDVLNSKIEKIEWLPGYSKLKLIDFLQKMPKSYNLILSKSREFTLSYNKFLLDPRYITILTYLLNKQPIRNRETTIIHGDVLKKFDYYLLCHIKNNDLPEKIVNHGIITDAQGQKVKRSPSSSTLAENSYSPKAIRCLLLKNDIFKGIKFDESHLNEQVKQVTKYYLKITQMINAGVNNTTKNIIDSDYILFEDRKEFIIALNNFKFGKCFVLFTKMVDFLWNTTRNKGLNTFESEILSNFLLLYYGDNGNGTQNVCE